MRGWWEGGSDAVLLPGEGAAWSLIIGNMNIEVLNKLLFMSSLILPSPLLYNVMWKAANKSQSEVDGGSLLLRRKDPSTNSFSSLGSQTHS